MPDIFDHIASTDQNRKPDIPDIFDLIAAGEPRNPAATAAGAAPRRRGDVIDTLAARRGLLPGTPLARSASPPPAVNPDTIRDSDPSAASIAASYVGGPLHSLYEMGRKWDTNPYAEPLLDIADAPISGMQQADARARTAAQSGLPGRVLAESVGGLPAVGSDIRDLSMPAVSLGEGSAPSPDELTAAARSGGNLSAMAATSSPTVRRAVSSSASKLTSGGSRVHPSVMLNGALGPSAVDTTSGINVGEALGREGIVAKSAADLHGQVVQRLDSLRQLRDGRPPLAPADMELDHRIANLERAESIANDLANVEARGATKPGSASRTVGSVVRTVRHPVLTAAEKLTEAATSATSGMPEMRGGHVRPLPKNIADLMGRNAAAPLPADAAMQNYARTSRQSAAPTPHSPQSLADASIAATESQPIPYRPGAEQLPRPASPQPMQPQFAPPPIDLGGLPGSSRGSLRTRGILPVGPDTLTPVSSRQIALQNIMDDTPEMRDVTPPRISYESPDFQYETQGRNSGPLVSAGEPPPISQTDHIRRVVDAAARRMARAKFNAEVAARVEKMRSKDIGSSSPSSKTKR